MSVHNPEAYTLTESEIKAFRADPDCQARLFRSYVRMLNFWGMEVSAVNGAVTRADNYKIRYYDWDGGHNMMRYGG